MTVFGDHTVELVVDGESIPITAFEYSVARNSDMLYSWAEDMAVVLEPPSVDLTMTFEGPDADAFIYFMQSAMRDDDVPFDAVVGDRSSDDEPDPAVPEEDEFRLDGLAD